MYTQTKMLSTTVILPIKFLTTELNQDIFRVKQYAKYTATALLYEPGAMDHDALYWRSLLYRNEPFYAPNTSHVFVSLCLLLCAVSSFSVDAQPMKQHIIISHAPYVHLMIAAALPSPLSPPYQFCTVRPMLHDAAEWDLITIFTVSEEQAECMISMTTL